MKQPPQRIVIGAHSNTLPTLLAHALASQGVEVEVAHTHKALLRMCRIHRYGLIITQFTKPLLEAENSVATLRHNSPTTPLFVLSHTRNHQLVMRLLERGVTQFLSLPVSLPRLCRKVEATLHPHTLNSQRL